jgi:multidrug efflux pump subunit AcrA (membrane-fusion protein)
MTRPTKKQRECQHETILSGGRDGRHWYYCQSCSAMFAPKWLVADANRELAEVRRQRDVDRRAWETARNVEITARDQARGEAAQAREEYLKLERDLRRVRAENDSFVERMGNLERSVTWLRKLLTFAIGAES